MTLCFSKELEGQLHRRTWASLLTTVTIYDEMGVSTDWGAGTHGECSTAISEVLETNRLVSSFNSFRGAVRLFHQSTRKQYVSFSEMSIHRQQPEASHRLDFAQALIVELYKMMLAPLVRLPVET